MDETVNLADSLLTPAELFTKRVTGWLDLDPQKLRGPGYLRSQMHISCRIRPRNGSAYKEATEIVDYLAYDLYQGLKNDSRYAHQTKLLEWLREQKPPKVKIYTDAELLANLQLRQKMPFSHRRREGESPGGSATPSRLPAAAGKAPALRPPGAKKRNHDEYSASNIFGPPSGERRQRTVNYAAQLRTVEQVEEDERLAAASSTGRGGDDASDSDDDDDTSSQSSGESIPAADATVERTVVRIQKLPLSTIPKGPNGTWVCEWPECDFYVRASASPAAQEKDIVDHLRQHEEQERMDLVMRESEATHLPTGYAYFPPFLVIVTDAAQRTPWPKADGAAEGSQAQPRPPGGSERAPAAGARRGASGLLLDGVKLRYHHFDNGVLKASSFKDSRPGEL